VVFLDVDHLKATNDAGGHAAGDRMLVQVVQALTGALRAVDLVIRYGGDEFVCVLPGIDMADADRRLADVMAPLAAAREPASVTVGVAELQAGDSSKGVVARADAALYRKRQQHRRA